MSRHAQIEEVSDSEPELDSDPDEVDIDSLPASQSLINPANIPASQAPQAPQRPAFDPAITKKWVCLYPVYFDATRTRQQGRRVSKEQAVQNPLARTILDAAAGLGLNVYMEAGKMHSKDWANPGRVKVFLKDESGKIKRADVKNKHHLYVRVSEYLQKHPTTEETPMKFPIRGMPLPEEPLAPPAVPRGWKIGTILPLHSPAVSGGGVSEDLLKDMMGQIPGMPGGSGTVPGMGKKAKKPKVIRA